MRIEPLMLRSLVLLAVAVPAVATESAPPSPGALFERLAAGELPDVVASEAGCADVASLEAYLLDEPQLFLRVTAPFAASEAGEASARPQLMTPLSAEKRGIRAVTPFSVFALGDSLFEPAPLGRTGGFTVRWHPAPLAFPEPPGWGGLGPFGFDDPGFAPRPW